MSSEPSLSAASVDGLPGRFQVLAKLGQGGMALVYLALLRGPHGFNKLVVLKTLRSECADDGEFREMFLNEARLVAKLNHSNVVQTYEVGDEGGRPYIAMEYLDGQTLSSVVQRRGYDGVPVLLHLLMISDMLDALHYAHELTDLDGTPLGLIHRDVSPQNLIVTYDGLVKLVDFGIAKANGTGARTQTGVLKGKLRYIAPEQVLGEDVDCRADVFSAGVMLWEALAGRRLVENENEASVLHRRVTGGDPKVLEVNPAAAPALAAVCAKAMALQPDDRYATAREFQQALEAAAEETSWRSSRRDLGRLVAEAFARERHALRQVIERHGTKLSGATADVTFGATAGAVRGPARRRGPAIALIALAAAGVGGWGWPGRRPAATSGVVAPPAPSFVLRVDTAPPGASLYEDDRMVGTTPAAVVVSRREVAAAPRRFILRREGYEPYQFEQGPAEGDQRVTATLRPSGPPPLPAAEVPSLSAHHVRGPVGRPRRAPASPVAAPPAPPAPSAARPASHLEIEMQR